MGRRRKPRWHGRAAYAAVAGLVVLGGSAAHGSLLAHPHPSTGGGAPEPGGDGGSPLYPDQPPALPGTPSPSAPSGPGPGGGQADTSELGIPATVLDAYQRAAQKVAGRLPDSHLRWQILAGIGRVESDHAEGGDVDASGTARHPILGPALDGTGGNERVANAYGSRWDQGGAFARAVGPMQFLPDTWARWGVDGNGDGVADPENVYDAALAAADYLTADGRDLATADGLRAAILSYNHSEQYYETVLGWINAYSSAGIPAIPDGTPVPPPHPTPSGGDQGTPRRDRPGPPPSGPTPPPTRSPSPSPSPSSSPPSTPPASSPPASPPPSSAPPTKGPCGPLDAGTATPTGAPTGTPTASPTGTPTPPPCHPATPPATTPTATPTTTPTAGSPSPSPQRPTATPTATARPSQPPADPPSHPPVDPPSHGPSKPPTATPTSSPSASAQPTPTSSPSAASG